VRDAARDLRFLTSLAPLLHITCFSAADRAALKMRLDQVVGLGATAILRLFGDIPSVQPDADRPYFASFAAVHADLAKDMLAHLYPLGGRILFCPTECCGRMAGGDRRYSAYLQTLGRDMDPGNEILWTGPEIVQPFMTPKVCGSLARSRAANP